MELPDRQDAWIYLRRAGPRIHAAIISDVVMPGLTATELIERWRDRGLALPIILMSAASTDELRARGLNSSPVPLLTKPVANEQLLALMHSVLGMSAAR